MAKYEEIPTNHMVDYVDKNTRISLYMITAFIIMIIIQILLQH